MVIPWTMSFSVSHRMANHLHRQEHTVAIYISHCSEPLWDFTLPPYKQNFTISKFSISRFQYIPLLVHSCCFMWERIQKFFRCFVSWQKTQDHYSDLDLSFRKQQLQVGTQMADMMAMLRRNYSSISSSVCDAECKPWSF